MARWALLALAGLAAGVGVGVGVGMAMETAALEAFRQPRDASGRFVNLDGSGPKPPSAVLRWAVVDRVLGRRRRSPERAPIAAVAPDLARLAHPPQAGAGARITWIGHATFLVQLDGLTFITDPVLSDSLPGWVRRNVAPGVPSAALTRNARAGAVLLGRCAPCEDLPRVDAALVSHSHYDHLDLPTLERLRVPVYAGLGLRRLLEGRGLVVSELGWWRSAQLGAVRITFVPAQHWSRRTLGDANRTLWGGFVLEGTSATVYHAGDSAYFEGFREIGRRHRIDAALLPIGAYDPPWFMSPQHMNPEQALSAFEDLSARTFFAMHWGTFKLTDEPLDEPPQRLEAERARRGIPRERVRVLAIGETAEVRAPAGP